MVERTSCYHKAAGRNLVGGFAFSFNILSTSLSLSSAYLNRLSRRSYTYELPKRCLAEQFGANQTDGHRNSNTQEHRISLLINLEKTFRSKNVHSYYFLRYRYETIRYDIVSSLCRSTFWMNESCARLLGWLVTSAANLEEKARASYETRTKKSSWYSFLRYILALK